MRYLHRLAAGAATTAIALSWLASAHAQSTASQVGEVVVTGSRQPKNFDGVVTQVQEAKDESVVSQAFFARQTPGENAGQLINLLPGVSFVSEDPTGISSGDLRIHGQDGAHVAILIDGAPVNDTGNYASYLGEYLIPEVTDHITVNIGATDVDSPTASAVGGTVNIVSKNPATTPGVIAQYTGGDYSLQREFAEVDSGTFGPFNTRAYVAFNFQDSDKYRGAGTEGPRIGVDGAVYQPLRGNGDFARVAFTYDQERPDFYYSFNHQQLALYGPKADYLETYFNPTVKGGVRDIVPTQTQFGNGDSNYYALHPNPVDFGQVRGQSYLSILNNLHLTFDPYFFYTRANGGGATAINENDPRLIGSSATGKGVDLNHDGDVLDQVLLYSPSDTQTHRYGVNTSLLYDLDPHNHFQLGYTLDYGRHRQTAPYTFIEGGQPDNVFGGTDGYGRKVYTDDGSFLRNRDRYSIATLNQFSFNYIGKFLNDNLHINLGMRDPFFVRHLNQYCFTYNGTSAYCDSVNPAAVQALINAAQANNGAAEATNVAALGKLLGVTPSYNKATDTVNLRAPFTQRFSFNKPLPNVGATYRLAEHNLFYVTYAEGYSAPKTDDLYTSSTELVKPESSSEYGAGYRYQDRKYTASLNGYYEIYRNRIVQSFDPNDPTLSIDRNVGRVDIYGFDGEVGTQIIDHLTLYLSGSYLHSKVAGNYQSVQSGVLYLVPTAGKELVDTPDYTIAGRAQYDFGPASIGLQGKYTSSRFTTDVNDDQTPGYATFDVDGRYNLNILGYTGSYLQFNISNVLNRSYLGRISTTANYRPYISPNGVAITGSSTSPTSTSGPYFYIGAPRFFSMTLRAAF